MRTQLCKFYATEIAKTGYTTLMETKGFKATLMRAQKLKDTGTPHGLPPGETVPTYPVDALPACPENWLRGQGSYVCPVSSDCGLWFDWTMNDQYNTAVLASVKGMNPITGRKLENLSLEKYIEKCPIHETPFQTGLLCEKCGYKWPPQSYVAAPNVLWWDGFRQADGTVRQFFFTSEEERDIASIVIGKHNTVPAFGFAFYEPVKRRSSPVSVLRSGSPFNIHTTYLSNSGNHYGSSGGSSGGTTVQDFNSMEPLMSVNCCSVAPPTNSDCSLELTSGFKSKSRAGGQSALRSGQMVNKSVKPIEIEKAVSVGAGAEIRQDLEPDPLSVSDWKNEPSAVMRLYFVFEKQFKKIIDEGGIKDLNGNKEGFLKGLPVG